MRFYEVQDRYKPFEVTVNIPGGQSFRTLLYAQTPNEAQQLAYSLFGRKQASSVRTYVPEDSQPNSPEQQRIKSLSDQAKKFRAMAQQERAKLSARKAQQSSSNTLKPLQPIKPSQ